MAIIPSNSQNTTNVNNTNAKIKNPKKQNPLGSWRLSRFLRGKNKKSMIVNNHNQVVQRINSKEIKELKKEINVLKENLKDDRTLKELKNVTENGIKVQILYTGDTKEDKIFAKQQTLKNTKNLEKISNSIEDIANEFIKRKKKQDISIKKALKASGNSVIFAKGITSTISPKSTENGILSSLLKYLNDTLGSAVEKYLKFLLGYKIIKGLWWLAKLPFKVVVGGFKALGKIGNLAKNVLKKGIEGIKWFGYLPKKAFDGLSSFVKLLGQLPSRSYQKLKDIFLGTGRIVKTGFLKGIEKTKAFKKVIVNVTKNSLFSIGNWSKTALIGLGRLLINPVTLSVAAVGLVSYGIARFMGYNNKDIMNKLKSALRWVTDNFIRMKDSIVEWGSKKFIDLKEWLFDNFRGLKEWWDSWNLKGVGKSLLQWWSNFYSEDFIANFKYWFGSKNTYGSLHELKLWLFGKGGIKESIKELVKSPGEFVIKSLKNIVSGTGELIYGLLTGSSKTSHLGNLLHFMAKGTWEFVKNIGSSISRFLGLKFIKSDNSIINSIGKFLLGNGTNSVVKASLNTYINVKNSKKEYIKWRNNLLNSAKNAVNNYPNKLRKKLKKLGVPEAKIKKILNDKTGKELLQLDDYTLKRLSQTGLFERDIFEYSPLIIGSHRFRAKDAIFEKSFEKYIKEKEKTFKKNYKNFLNELEKKKTLIKIKEFIKTNNTSGLTKGKLQKLLYLIDYYKSLGGDTNNLKFNAKIITENKTFNVDISKFYDYYKKNGFIESIGYFSNKIMNTNIAQKITKNVTNIGEKFISGYTNKVKNTNTLTNSLANNTNNTDNTDNTNKLTNNTNKANTPTPQLLATASGGLLQKAMLIVKYNESKGKYNLAGDIGDGAGITFGAYQITEKSGILKKFVCEMANQGVQGAIGHCRMFGQTWYRGSHTNLTLWLRRIGNSEVSKKIQDAIFVRYFYNPAIKLAKSYGITDNGSILHIVDHTLNAGIGGARKMLKFATCKSPECIATARMKYYRSLSSWNKWGKSWTNRVKYVSKAVGMSAEQIQNSMKNANVLQPGIGNDNLQNANQTENPFENYFKNLFAKMIGIEPSTLLNKISSYIGIDISKFSNSSTITNGVESGIGGGGGGSIGDSGISGDAASTIPTNARKFLGGYSTNPGNISGFITLVGTAKEGFYKLHPVYQARIIAYAKYFKQNYGQNLIIRSAYRSVQHQMELYNSHGRNRKWVAPPGRSFHNNGLAIDIDNSQASKINDSVLLKFKLWRRMLHEPWHIEPIETKQMLGITPDMGTASKTSNSIGNSPNISIPENSTFIPGGGGEGIKNAMQMSNFGSTKEILELNHKIEKIEEKVLGGEAKKHKPGEFIGILRPPSP